MARNKQCQVFYKISYDQEKCKNAIKTKHRACDNLYIILGP